MSTKESVAYQTEESKEVAATVPTIFLQLVLSLELCLKLSIYQSNELMKLKQQLDEFIEERQR